MPEFKVICFHRGIWDNEEARTKEAHDAKTAAEEICGCTLEPTVESQGNPGQLRAKVWPVSSPKEWELFWDKGQ